MKLRNQRLEAVKLLVSTQNLGSHEEILNALAKMGYQVTQATLSRDLKRLKVAKASRPDGKYTYVLPNEAMYRRVNTSNEPMALGEGNGLLSVRFSQNMAVIKTRNGYASAIAYDIDQLEIPDILGTIAGADTVFMVLADGASYSKITETLKHLVEK